MIDDWIDTVPPSKLLNNWRYFDLHLKVLEGLDRTRAIRFYKALKQLEKSEVTFLAQFYYNEPKHGMSIRTGYYKYSHKVTDQEIADRLGLKKNQVSSQRRHIEMKMDRIFDKMKRNKNVLLNYKVSWGDKINA
ncbi:MAG: hypothetical protein LBM95_06655 [Lactobacillales bacterium]|jgi:hypothetical protein|nr:hypothetical protein [Lactobacillales bacterium]